MIRVPGKAILCGEHAAVYGCPALVAALGDGVRVALSECDPASSSEDEPGVQFHSSSLVGRRVHSVPWSQIFEFASLAQTSWQAFDDGRAEFRSLASLHQQSATGAEADPASTVDGAYLFLQVALAESWWHLAGDAGAPPPSCRVEIESDLPLGAGCGSSAAVAAAVAIAVAEARGPSPDLDLIEPLVHTIESRQHGRPSGIDGAAVLRGGLLLAQRQQGDWTFRRTGDPGQLLAGMRAAFTGSRPETTGDVVAAVRRQYEADRRRVEVLFDLIEQATLDMSDAFASADEALLRVAIRQAQGALEELGVVPAEVRRTLEELRSLGCVAKISGAGTLRGPGAGLLLLYDPADVAADVVQAAGYRYLPGALGVDGALEGRENSD